MYQPTVEARPLMHVSSNVQASSVRRKASAPVLKVNVPVNCACGISNLVALSQLLVNQDWCSPSPKDSCLVLVAPPVEKVHSMGFHCQFELSSIA
jgi:hypothetical protein